PPHGNFQVPHPSLPSYGDKHPRFGAPGTENDTEDLAEFLDVLMEIGFFKKQLPTRRPVVTFEVGARQGERQDVLMANCRRVFEEAWARVHGPATGPRDREVRGRNPRARRTTTTSTSRKTAAARKR